MSLARFLFPPSFTLFRSSKWGVFLIIIFMQLGCSSLVQKVAVGTTSNLLFDATGEIETEANWDIFAKGVPGNLKMMEGLLYLQPENKRLLAGLTKGYTGYAFAIYDTLSLEEEILGTDDGPMKKAALLNYSKAVEYGLRFFEAKGIKYSELQASVNKDGGVGTLLEKEFSDDILDLEGAFFTAQSLGGLIVHQRDDMLLVAQLPIVKGIFDWVCTKKPDINFGACDIFYGAYESGRPKALGGNPTKGKEHFLQAIAKNPHNWLTRTNYMRFYLVPMGEEAEFKKHLRFLEDAEEKFQTHNKWRPIKSQGEEFTEKRLALYQAIALKQYEIFKKYKNKIF